MAAVPAHPDRDSLSADPRALPAAADPSPAPLPEPLGAGVYVHVPFCHVRCPYCDFATRPYRPAEVPGFVEGIVREAERRGNAAAREPYGSLYYGGGTPSRLPAGDFTRLARGLDRALSFHPEHEHSLEANPEDLDDERLAAWREAGVARLSIGAQSLHDDELARLGRTHDARAIEEGVRRARRHGFANLSLDLMYAFPGHLEERFDESLERALALDPDHVSAYAFTPEAGTRMGEAVRRGRVERPDEDREAAFFERARDRLEAAGFRHYEISNFARDGHETRHHLAYWRRRPYLGLGPAAVSFLAGRRTVAPRALPAWIASIESGGAAEVDEAEAHAMFETVFLGLRLDAGMRFADVSAAVSDEVREAWRAAGRRLAARGLLVEMPEGFRVPRRERVRTDSICLLWQNEATAGTAGLV
ncbi:MAG: radical SAM family heme chaperone HemW [Candidatus Eiseniibacteriota bacterium]